MKKPIIVEAEQYFSNKIIEGICLRCIILTTPHIHTLEGLMLINEGDYIITEIQGEKYPIKSEIFDLTYDILDSDDLDAMKQYILYNQDE